MARERVIVKLALTKVKEALKNIIKVSRYADSRNSQIADIVDTNLLSLSLKFMNDTNKLPSLLDEVETVLSNYQRDNPEELQGNIRTLFEDIDNVGFWTVENKFDDPFLHYVYPTARALEALAPREPPKPLIMKGINFLYEWMEKEGFREMVQDKSKYAVPLMQTAVNTARNSRGSVKQKAERIIEEASKFSESKDLEDDIYAQTVRYTYFIYNDHVLSNGEVELLVNDINCGIFRRMLTGLEFLSALTFDLRQDSTDRILDMLPKFRKQIFDIVQEGKGAVYFASVSESMKHSLDYYQNKTFARSFFNLMVEESSWISQPIFHPIHISKALVGTSLLISSRGALRR